MAAGRASASYLLSSTSLSGPVRVAGHTSVFTFGRGKTKYVSLHSLASPVAITGPIRVSANYLVGARSVNGMFYLTRLESDSEIYDFNFGFKFEWSLVAGQIPEFNPYKPQVPETLINIPGTGRDLFDYIEENQKTLRLQHNITQAGDTTFPYQMVINSHGDKQFTLGSVGRFYHEDYGIISARYVQFDKMNPTLAPTAPVGLIKVTGELDWIVTNRLEISDPRLVVGVQAAYVMPTDGQFGWVIVDGVNLQPVVTEGDSTKIGTPYVWSSSGKVGPDGEGVVVCRRLFDGGDVTLLRGKAYIRLEGASFGSIDIHYAQLLADVAKLKTDVQALQDANDLDITLKAIQASLKTLGNRISLEQSARQSADSAINARIDALNAVTAGQLAAAVTALRTEILALLTNLSNQIDATNEIAIEALEKATQALSLDLTGIQTQINEILAIIFADRVRAKGRFPLVDGSIPPNLVYLGDGSLVYVETF